LGTVNETFVTKREQIVGVLGLILLAYVYWTWYSVNGPMNALREPEVGGGSYVAQTMSSLSQTDGKDVFD
jgi:hypothetical protein